MTRRRRDAAASPRGSVATNRPTPVAAVLPVGYGRAIAVSARNLPGADRGPSARTAPEDALEFVWVVKREDLFSGRTPHGLEVLDEWRMAEHVSRILEHGFFVERRHAERDPSMKQVIPYCVVVRGAEVFRMRRLARGGETRLHGKRTIGVGGHLNPVDGGDVLVRGLRREIDEELVVDGPWTARPVGLLNDDSTEVGAVHVGLVHLVETAADVRIRETDVLEGAWAPLAEVAESCRRERESWETWSALVIDRLAGDPSPFLVPPGGLALRTAPEPPAPPARSPAATPDPRIRARVPSGTP